MENKIILRMIMFISLIGVLFSGYLSYTEVFKQICILGEGTCSDVFKIPACVYGFGVFFILFVISLIGLKKNKSEKTFTY